MTEPQLWETFRVFDAIGKVEHTANRERGIVTLAMRDARHGNTVVRDVSVVPTPDQARAILEEMKQQIAARAKKTRQRVAGEKSC